MKCPRCVEEGLKSVIEIGYSTRTAMMAYTYYDEDGKFVVDDPNTTTTVMHCSNGHHLVRTTQGLHEQIEVLDD